jgi:hypothetical protein
MTNRQDDAGRRYPYDRLAESGDYDEALDELWASRKDGKPHIPTFARGMLEQLREVGLLHRTDTESPVNVRRAKLGKGQEAWIRFDTRRDYHQGYMAVEAINAPRSDRAILAAMVAWLTPRIDLERFREAQYFDLSGGYAAEEKRARDSIGMEIVNGFPVIRDNKDNTWEDFVSYQVLLNSVGFYATFGHQW